MTLSGIVSPSVTHIESHVRVLLQETLFAFVACRDLFSEIQKTDNPQDAMHLAVIGEEFLKFHQEVIEKKIAETFKRIQDTQQSAHDFPQSLSVCKPTVVQLKSLSPLLTLSPSFTYTLSTITLSGLFIFFLLS